MKRISGLFHQIHDRENIITAFWKASRDKGLRPEVRRFCDHLDANVSSISEELRSGRFCFQNYQAFEVRDTKSRTIQAPTFRDRVVHHAMINVVGEVFEKGAIEHSYACRLGRGQHAALRQARTWTRRTGWYGKMDIRKYYDSIDHGLLRARLARRFREQTLLSLFDCLLDSWCSTPGRGLPIGALTSQYLSNFYLDPFDARMKATGLCHRYVRYMDDIVVWTSAEKLGVVRECARTAVAELSLEIKHGGEWNRCENGVPFLGFVIYPDRIRLGRLARRRLRRKLHSAEQQHQVGHISESDYQSRCTSLFAHARFSDDVNWRRTVLSFHGSQEDCGDMLERRSSDPWWLLEQFREELPSGLPQQEEARQPQQESGLPSLLVPRHEGESQPRSPPDDVCSRSGL